MKTSTKSLLIFALLMLHQLVFAGSIISATDKKVHKTVIAADGANKNVVIFWTSESLKNFKGRVSLYFNCSTDGGNSWMRTPIPFAGNAKSRWINDFLPALCFDKSGRLHTVWLQADNKTAPRYSMTKDPGKNWLPPSIIGSEKAICGSGVSLAIDTNNYSLELNPFKEDESTDELDSKQSHILWSMYDEYRRYGIMVETSQVKWHSVKVKLSRIYNGPGKVIYALQHDLNRYILRLQQGTKLFLLRYKNKKWSSRLVFESKQKLQMANTHSFAIDSIGTIYIVFSDQGKLNCLYSESFSGKWKEMVLPAIKGTVKVPVIGISEKGNIYITCQVDTPLDKKGGKIISTIAYTASLNRGKSWSKLKLLQNSGTNQSFPDMVIVKDKLLISYTQDKQAGFTLVQDSGKQ